MFCCVVESTFTTQLYFVFKIWICKVKKVLRYWRAELHSMYWLVSTLHCKSNPNWVQPGLSASSWQQPVAPVSWGKITATLQHDTSSQNTDPTNLWTLSFLSVCVCVWECVCVCEGETRLLAYLGVTQPKQGFSEYQCDSDLPSVMLPGLRNTTNHSYCNLYNKEERLNRKKSTLVFCSYNPMKPCFIPHYLKNQPS